MENTSSGKNIPEKKFSTGVISATIWKNNGTSKRTGEPVEFRTITLQRRYTDKDGKWQTSSNLRVNDLPKAALVLNKAYEYVVLKQDAGISTTEEEIVM
jgi:hypothetical protein